MDDRIEFHAPFLETAVQAVVDADARAPMYHRDREAIYSLEDPAARDRAFGRLAAGWFQRLALDAPIRRAIEERTAGLVPVGRVLVGPAVRPADEGADLLVAPGVAPTLVIRILPVRCRDGAGLLTQLRRELLHIADILDPAFRYEPRLPPQPAGPAHDRIIQDRYRLLWDCSVDGRLVHAGLLAEEVRDVRRREYRRAFGYPGLADSIARAATAAARARAAAPAFGTIFHGPRPTHLELVEIAAGRSAGTTAGHRCSLCAFPTMSIVPDPAGLPAPVLDTIRSEFPGWNAGDTLCIQCADLYRARAAAPAPETDPTAVAMTAAAAVPLLEGCR